MSFRGNFKVLKMTSSSCYFASIDLVLSSKMCAEVTYHDKGVYFDDWVLAIKKGVKDSLNLFPEFKHLMLEEIIEFRGTDIDTTSRTVWCATVMATLRAIGKHAELSFLDKENPEWQIEVNSQVVLRCPANVYRV